MDYFRSGNPNTKSFLIDSVDEVSARTLLAKQNIDVLGVINALFADGGVPVMVEFTVSKDVDENDISFALDSGTKTLRPYPKSFPHKG